MVPADVAAGVLEVGVRQTVHDGLGGESVGRGSAGDPRGPSVVAELGRRVQVALEAVGLLQLGRVAHRAGALAAAGTGAGAFLEATQVSKQTNKVFKQ